MRDGDLWQVFADVVRQRGPYSVIITKVKGHATEQMVQDGKVERCDKEGNDKADKAAELGATISQARVQAFGRLYSCRQQEYRTFVCRVQRYIVALKEEERRLIKALKVAARMTSAGESAGKLVHWRAESADWLVGRFPSGYTWS